MSADLKHSFFKLTTDRVLDAVEAAMALEKPGVRATGQVIALNSLENRVYQIEFDDRSFVVAKFYRPGRWSEDQIAEEHRFLLKLLEVEIPVVAPFRLKDSPLSKLTQQPTLARSQDKILFAVFPKVRGRLLDELSEIQLQTLGRYVGRLHNIGSQWPAKHRLKMSADLFGLAPLESICQSPFIDPQSKAHYRQAAEKVIAHAENKLKGVPMIALHGDCHLGNTLWSGDAPFFLDFDDMMTAPAVQDIWMIIRGRDDEARKQRETLLAAYEQMFAFDYSTLSLIEPLRGLRIIHYSAWIAKRWDDPSFPQAFPQFGTPGFWRDDTQALNEICDLILQGGSFTSENFPSRF